MIKFRLQISVLAITLFSIQLSAQPVYQLHLKGSDHDSVFIVTQAGLQTHFNSRTDLAAYINKLPGYLQTRGYITASIDSLHYDSSFAKMVLYLGHVYRWAILDVRKHDEGILDAVGWRGKMFRDRVIDFKEVGTWQNKVLNHLENSGYPFAKVYLDSLSFTKKENSNEEIVSAILAIQKGPLYKIDSIRLYGNAKITNSFLQRYLELPNGSVYNQDKLFRINKKIRELAYVEEEKPADLSMLGTGSVLNIYLRQKKSSQVNVIVGFLPNNNQLTSKKLLVTGEGNLLLRNGLGFGETIGLNFQKLQVSSERLNFVYQHPYMFNSPVGLDFAFDIFRKDSSFVNLNAQLGAQYVLNTHESGKLFIQKTSTIVNEGAINEALIIQSRRLPDVADLGSFNIGLEYEYNKTDYRPNPKKGHELNLITSIGSKKIKKNNSILALKDPVDPSYDFNKLYDTVKLQTYQFRVKAYGANYFPLGNKRSTVKTAVNAGMFQSRNIFRNELFQLGGFKILRGFDEESQYLSSYAIGTIEFRYLLAQNSFFYLLADGGWGQDNRQHTKINYTYFGTGLGLAFETKAGIFNLAWAIGKRNDTELNLRQSKIHFGFVNYF